jgi:hypothetical protein
MCVLLIAILVGFEAVPITTGSDVQYINQAALQRVRSQVFAKSVYALKYHTDGERAQAISDLQVTLPLFEQEQAVLLSNSAPDVQMTVQATRSDYLALVTAIQSILTHPTTSNSIEIDIVLSHERGYLTTSNTLITMLQKHADDRILQLFCIKAFIEALVVILIILSIFVTRRIAELKALAIEHAESTKVEA